MEDRWQNYGGEGSRGGRGGRGHGMEAGGRGVSVSRGSYQVEDDLNIMTSIYSCKSDGEHGKPLWN